MDVPYLQKIAASSDWKAKSAKIMGRLAEFSRLFKTKKYGKPDDLFFAIEDLPSLGKEYWFLHFCAPPNDEQVVLTLGRSVDSVKVNEASVDFEERQGSATCAAVCWFYSGKKRVVFDSVAAVRVERSGASRSLIAQNGADQISVRGSYPDFEVELSKGGRAVFSARATKPKKGIPYEMVHLLRTPFAPRLGAVMINYYFDFAGELEGKKLSGKAYLQKVVAVLPLAPWNWVRLHFGNGAALDFFAANPLGEKAGMHFDCNDYFEINGRRVRIRELRLKSYLEGERRLWVLSGKNFFAAMETYSMQPFIMRQKTTFRYDEYLVRVRSFALRDGKREYSLADLGGGVGIVEDAYGFLL